MAEGVGHCLSMAWLDQVKLPVGVSTDSCETCRHVLCPDVQQQKGDHAQRLFDQNDNLNGKEMNEKMGWFHVPSKIMKYEVGSIFLLSFTDFTASC